MSIMEVECYTCDNVFNVYEDDIKFIEHPQVPGLEIAYAFCPICEEQEMIYIYRIVEDVR